MAILLLRYSILLTFHGILAVYVRVRSAHAPNYRIYSASNLLSVHSIAIGTVLGKTHFLRPLDYSAHVGPPYTISAEVMSTSDIETPDNQLHLYDPL